jgi:hypothetical protein
MGGLGVHTDRSAASAAAPSCRSISHPASAITSPVVTSGPGRASSSSRQAVWSGSLLSAAASSTPVSTTSVSDRTLRRACPPPQRRCDRSSMRQARRTRASVGQGCARPALAQRVRPRSRTGLPRPGGGFLALARARAANCHLVHRLDRHPRHTHTPRPAVHQADLPPTVAPTWRAGAWRPSHAGATATKPPQRPRENDRIGTIAQSAIRSRSSRFPCGKAQRAACGKHRRMRIPR